MGVLLEPGALWALIHLSNGFFKGLFGGPAMLGITVSRVVRDAVPFSAPRPPDSRNLCLNATNNLG